MTNDRYFVIAGTYEEYIEFIRRKTMELWNQGQTSVSFSHFTHVIDVSQVKGCSNPKGWFIGSWKEKENVDWILMGLITSSSNDIGKTTKLKELLKEYDEYRSRLK